MKQSLTPFWEKPQGGKIIIKHYEFIQFLQDLGFARMTDKPANFGVLVKIEDNVVRLSSDSQIIQCTADYLIHKREASVLEIFTRQASNLTANCKLGLLKTIPILNHSDGPNATWLYFINTAIKISKEKIEWIEYSDLNHQIWEESIIKHDLKSNEGINSQFEDLCLNVANKQNDRFLALQTNIGYLISRFNDPSNPKAIILLDENIDINGTANGGTGKSLISQALQIVRTTIFIDGKKYNPKYIFGNQRISITTNIIWYDDVRDNFSLEDVYSMLTSGVEVHKKFKSPIFIKPSQSPKILICSNYVVKGTSGNTDKRRRCEFELSAHYNETHQPIDDFGKLFYSEWDSVDYNRFYHAMIKFAQKYLQDGLLTAKPINLPANRLIALTSEIFIKYVEGNIDLNKKLDKRTKLDEFNDILPTKDKISSHQFTKWLKIYAFEKELDYGDQSTGGTYLFWMYEKNESVTNKEEQDEEESS